MRKYKIIRLLILLILLLSLLTIGLVLILLYRKNNHIVKYEPMEVKFENVYVIDQVDSMANFLYKGRNLSFSSDDYHLNEGLYDLVVKDGSIISYTQKTDLIEGCIIKYKKGLMYIKDENGKISEIPYNDNFSVYSFLKGQVSQSSTNNFVFGETELTFVLYEGKICSILQYKEPTYNYIRVLLKNEDGIYYGKDVSVKRSGEFSYLIDGKGNRLTNDCPGNLELLDEEEGLVAINTLPVEDYVRYVTPSEMPYKWNEEALKAQAVCARTYAYSQMKNSRYAAYGANLDNTVDYQVYNSTGLKDSTNKAAEDTAYQVLAGDNQLITCYFFSTSAGKTNTMEVWGSSNPSYLHSVESVDSDSAFYEWSASLDYSIEDSNKLGKILQIKSFGKNEGGYNTRILIQYEKGARTYTNEYKIRSILAQHMKDLKDKNGRSLEGWALLPSAAFSITESEDKISISGNGYGHGIGMSQYGAQMLAKDGKTYKEILTYYYANVQLVDIRELVK